MANWDGWEKTSSGEEEVHDFQKTPVLKGKFVEKRENIGANNSNMYIFEVADGERVAVWGSALLDTRLKNLVIGEDVGIEYLGKAVSEKSGRSYHNYEIYRRPMQKQGDEIKTEDIPF